MAHSITHTPCIPPTQMLAVTHGAGVKIHGFPWLLDFLSDHVLPHYARLLGFRPAYPEYSSGVATAKDTADREPEWAADEL